MVYDYYNMKLTEHKQEYSAEDIYTVIMNEIYKELPLYITEHLVLMLNRIRLDNGTEEWETGIHNIIEGIYEEEMIKIISELREQEEVEVVFSIDTSKIEELIRYNIENVSRRTHEKMETIEYNRIEIENMEKELKEFAHYTHSTMLYYLDKGKSRKYTPTLVENVRKALDENGIGNTDEINMIIRVLAYELETKEDVYEENWGKKPHVTDYI